VTALLDSGFFAMMHSEKGVFLDSLVTGDSCHLPVPGNTVTCPLKGWANEKHPNPLRHPFPRSHPLLTGQK